MPIFAPDWIANREPEPDLDDTDISPLVATVDAAPATRDGILGGERVVIKDAVDIAGTRTGLGLRDGGDLAEKDASVVARIRARRPGAKGVLLLAHIDVVDAKREDWQRDPFRLIEEDGFFYGRGSVDDKSMAAVFLDLMIRLKRDAISSRGATSSWH